MFWKNILYFSFSDNFFSVPTSQNNYDCNKKYCDRSNLNDADYKVLNGTNGDCEDCAARCDAENNCTGFECNGDLGSNERCIGYYGNII